MHNGELLAQDFGCMAFERKLMGLVSHVAQVLVHRFIHMTESSSVAPQDVSKHVGVLTGNQQSHLDRKRPKASMRASLLALEHAVVARDKRDDGRRKNNYILRGRTVLAGLVNHLQGKISALVDTSTTKDLEVNRLLDGITLDPLYAQGTSFLFLVGAISLAQSFLEHLEGSLAILQQASDVDKTTVARQQGRIHHDRVPTRTSCQTSLGSLLTGTLGSLLTGTLGSLLTSLGSLLTGTLGSDRLVRRHMIVLGARVKKVRNRDAAGLAGKHCLMLPWK